MLIALLSTLPTSSLSLPRARVFALNKPYGVLSQFVGNGRKKRSQCLLGDLPSVAEVAEVAAINDEPLMAVGRLDQHTEGLLLLTNCGKFSRSVTYGLGPSRIRLEKEYWVQVDGVIGDEAIDRLRNGGIEIGEGEKMFRTKPSAVRRVEDDEARRRVGERAKRSIRDSSAHGPTSWVSLSIKEGRNRQVRKMTAAVGFPTLRLVRVRVGGLELDGLESGGVKEVMEDDVMKGIT